MSERVRFTDILPVFSYLFMSMSHASSPNVVFRHLVDDPADSTSNRGPRSYDRSNLDV